MLESSKGKKSLAECGACCRQNKTTVGTHWCLECNEPLCPTCLSTHQFIKTLINHKVLKIDEMGTNSNELDLNAISDKCAIHGSKVVEAYCYDHKELCCILCITLKHRQCDDVRAIEDMSEDQTCEMTEVRSILDKARRTAEGLVTRKEQQQIDFEKSVKRVENSASASVASIKHNLDTLLISFLKELTLFGDGQVTEIEGQVQRLQRVLSYISHVSKVNSLVTEHGTRIQQFIHVQDIKLQLPSNVLEVLQSLNEDPRFEAEFTLDKSLKSISEVSKIGTLGIKEHVGIKEPNNDIENVIETISTFLDIMNVKLVFGKLIHVTNAVFSCGVCASDTVILCGDVGLQKIYAIEITSGSVIHERSFHLSRKISYSKNKGFLFVSGINTCFYKYKYSVSGFSDIGPSSTLGNYYGGIDIYEDVVYVLVDSSIRKCPVTKQLNDNSMGICCESNTDCQIASSDLSVDGKNQRLIYISKDNGIIAVSLDGRQIFCYKNKDLQKPVSLALTSSGLILVGDAIGTVHAIEQDGKSHTTILQKCQKITELSEIWLNKAENILFACGNDSIEMYDIRFQ